MVAIRAAQKQKPVLYCSIPQTGSGYDTITIALLAGHADDV